MTVGIQRLAQGETFDFASLNLSPAGLHQLGKCMNVSFATFVGKIDDEIACVWGVVQPSIVSERAYLWMYVSPIVDEHKFTFVRHSQMVLREIQKEWPVVVGHCKMDAERSIRWIKWLGGQFGLPDSLGRVPYMIRKRQDG